MGASVGAAAVALVVAIAVLAIVSVSGDLGHPLATSPQVAAAAAAAPSQG
jgi:hypothetical protein